MSSGINSLAVNSYPINGEETDIPTTDVQALYWTDNVLYGVGVNEDVDAECVTIDFLPFENRTTCLPSRSSNLCC